MDILSVLSRAYFETKVRENWIAVFDKRPAFSAAFGTPRIGKVQNDHFYITPGALRTAAELLIKSSGYELHHLPSSSGTRDAVYPGFSIAGQSEEELERFVGILRNVINSHINVAA